MIHNFDTEKGDESEAEPQRDYDDIAKIYLQEIAHQLLTPEKEIELARRVAEGDGSAKRELIEANLRLVVSVAKRYTGQGMDLLDLVQEGNIGLMRAAAKFDYRRGWRFSTYATWWIRQAIGRALKEQARTIKIPAHVVETINRIKRIERSIYQETGIEPSIEELASAVGLPKEKVIALLAIADKPLSIDAPVDESEGCHLSDILEDATIAPAVEQVSQLLLRESIESALSQLTLKERTILEMRYGLVDGKSHTLKEVSKAHGLTHERIRQVEAKALRKLRRSGAAWTPEVYLQQRSTYDIPN